MLTAVEPQKEATAPAKRTAKTYGRKRDSAADGDAEAPARDAESPGPQSPRPARPRRTDASLHDVAPEDILELLGGGSPRRVRAGSPVRDGGPASPSPALRRSSAPGSTETAASKSRAPAEEADDGKLGEEDAGKSERRDAGSASEGSSPQIGVKRSTKKAQANSSLGSSPILPSRTRKLKRATSPGSDAENENDASNESPNSPAPPRQRKLLNKRRDSPPASNSDSDSGELEDVRDILARRGPSQSQRSSQEQSESQAAEFSSQPLPNDAELRLHFDDEDLIEEELRKDAERAKQMRKELALDFDGQKEPEEDNTIGTQAENRLSGAEEGSGAEGSGVDQSPGKKRRLKKLNRKGVSDLHRDSDRLQRTSIVTLEASVAKVRTMKDFLAVHGPKAKTAAAEDKAGKDPEATAPPAAPAKPSDPEQPIRPVLAKGMVIELDDDAPLPRQSHRPKPVVPKVAVETKDAATARNADLAKRLEQQALQRKEAYKRARERVLANRRKQEKEDDRLGIRKQQAADAAALNGQPTSEVKPSSDAPRPTEEEEEEQKVQGSDDLDSGDEDVVMGGIPESERPKKRKLQRRRNDSDEEQEGKPLAQAAKRAAAVSDKDQSVPIARPVARSPAGPAKSISGHSREANDEDAMDVDSDGELQPGERVAASRRVLQSSFVPPPENNSLFPDDEPSSYLPIPNMDSDASGDEERAGPSPRTSMTESQESISLGGIDSRHKIGFSQFFQDSQASMDGFAEPAGVDPNHRVGFSQLFAGSQFSAASARPSVDVTQPGVDPNHRIGFSQLFAGSQASADVRHPQGSSTQPGIDPKHKVGFSQLFAGSQAEFSGFGSADVTQANRHDPSVPIEPRAAESQDSADSMKIHLAYEDSLPLDNPLPAPDEPEPGPAFIADPIPPKPAPPNKDAIKAMKLKQVNKEKAKVEAVKALGKKGTDILSLFAKQQAKAKPSEETALSRAESDNEEDARGTQSEEVGAQDSERDDLEPDSRGEEGGSAGEDSDEGGSDGEEEGGDGEDSNADDSETETDAGVESEQPASEAAAGTSSALPSGPVGEDDEDEPIFKPKPKKGKSMYIVQEAEEEEDEFQGLGGPDGDDSDEDDGKDLADLIATGKDAVDAKPEDFETILRQHRADDAVKDQQELEQLLKDVTAGNLRKRRTDLSGRYLDDDDEDDADLEILLDMRRAADLARRYDTGKRKRGEEMSALEKLVSKPETAAFGRTFLKDIGDKTGFLDEEERRSDPLLVMSNANSAYHSENEDEYEEEDEEHGSSDRALDDDGNSDGESAISVRSDASEQSSRRPKIKRKRTIASDDDEDDPPKENIANDSKLAAKGAATLVNKPKSPALKAAPLGRPAKKWAQWVIEEDEEEPASKSAASATAKQPETTNVVSDDDEEDTFVIRDSSRKTPKKATSDLHPDAAKRRSAPGGSLLNRSPNALLKFAKSDVSDRVGGKARTFVVGRSESQPARDPPEFGHSQSSQPPSRNKSASSKSAGLLKALSTSKRR